MKIYIFIHIIILFQLHFSTDAMSQWSPVRNIYGGRFLEVVTNDNGNLLAYNVNRQLYQSYDLGESWGFVCDIPDEDIEVRDLTFTNKGEIFCLGKYLYHYNGIEWLPLSADIPDADWPREYAFKADSTFIIQVYSDFYRSKDFGNTWDKVSKGEYSFAVGQWPLQFSKAGVLYNKTSSGLYCSTDEGSSWRLLGGKQELRQATSFGRGLFIDRDSLIYCLVEDGVKAISIVDSTWRYVQSIGKLDYMKSLYCNNEGDLFTHHKLYEGPQPNKFMKSTDAGESWQQIDVPNYGGFYVHAVIATDSIILAFDELEYILKTDDNGRNWRPSMTGMNCSIGFNLDINDSLFFIYRPTESYYYTQYRDSWKLSRFAPPAPGREIIMLSNGAAVRARDIQISWSTNHGIHWHSVPLINYCVIPGPDSSVYMALTDEIISMGFMREFSSIISYFSSKKIATNSHDRMFAVNSNGSFLLINTDGSSQVESSNDLFIDIINSILISDNYTLLVQTSNGLFRSTDNGTNWGKTFLPDSIILKKIIEDQFGTFYSLSIDFDLYYSNNNGISWEGLEIPNDRIKIFDIDYDNTYLYAITNGYGLYKHPLKNLTTVPLNQIPSSFEVSELSPNPINSHLSKNLSFGIFVSRPAEISCEIYDLNGRKVLSEIKSLSSRGEHNVIISVPTGIRPGTYFLSVQSGTDNVTKKFVVM